MSSDLPLAPSLHQRFDDLIQLTLAPTLGLLAGENVPDARIWGFELEGSQSWGRGVTTGIDYSYTDSRDLDSGRVLPSRLVNVFDPGPSIYSR